MLKKIGHAVFACTFILFWLASNPDGGDESTTKLAIGAVGGALGMLFMAAGVLVEAIRIKR